MNNGERRRVLTGGGRVSVLPARLLVVALGLALLALAPLYAAYRGHANDRDVNAVLAVYPALKGTPSDSCAICHVRGEVKDAAGAVRDENHCDYCHAIFVRDKRDPEETLGRYGRDYLAAGRNEAAIRALAAKDADGDGFSNEAELKAGTDPGEAGSNPSIPFAPSRKYAVSQIKGLAPVLDATILLNTTKSRSGDSYSDYRGVSLWEILKAVGIEAGASAVDLLSADGYEHTFTVDELKKSWPQAPPAMGLGRKELGSCGWVTYGSRRLEAGKPLPSVPVMLAFEENGEPLEKARLDPADGRLVGKGPLRVIVPQFKISPPDLPQFADAGCPARVAPEYRFHEDYEHNGGASAYAIVAVRVKPLPRGTRDIDWQSASLRALDEEQVIFFGAIKSR
jgi:hypothetical protein